MLTNTENLFNLRGMVQLHKGKEESLKRFHPWLFSGAIWKKETQIREGDPIEVRTFDDKLAGVGHYADGSIAVRMITFNEEIYDENLLLDRLSKAYEIRKRLLLHTGEEVRTTAFRLVHGEGDFLPGLVIDIYGETAVMQAHSTGMYLLGEKIATLLPKATDGLVKAVYDKSEGTLPSSKRCKACDRFIIGHTEAKVEMENGIKFFPDWIRGQKTGFFIDQRDNRSLVEKYAKGREVLNMFCYTGGFSLYALRGGAKMVTSVDSSAKAVYLADKNVSENGWEERHNAVQADAFKYLHEIEEGKYDLIILDPPAFAKQRKVLTRALVGYRKLNAEAFKKIKAGGILFTFSCSQAVSKDEFRRAVFTAASLSGRKVRLLHQLTQPIDHPVNIYHPEGEYLKGLVLEVE